MSKQIIETEGHIAELTSQFQTNGRKIDRYEVRQIEDNGDRVFLCFAYCSRSWTVEARKKHIEDLIAA